MTLGRAPARSPARGALALGLALALAAGGCSFRFMKPPPRHEDWPNPIQPDSSEARCTASLAPPVVDTVVFSIFGTLAFIERNSIVYTAETLPNPQTGKSGVPHFQGEMPPSVKYTPVPSEIARGIAAGFAIGAIVAGVSAVYGYVNGTRCRKYQAPFHPPLD